MTDFLTGRPWAQAPWELVTAPISDKAFRVLMAIQLHRRPEGKAPFPSQKRLADMVGCSRPSVERAIRELRAVGILKCEQRRRADGGMTTSAYQLVIPPSITGDGGVSIKDDGTEVEEGRKQTLSSKRATPSQRRRTARDDLWDALSEATGIVPATKNEKSRFGQSVTLLLEAGATPLEVQARWKRWTKKHKGDVVAASTERVLVEHWGELSGPTGKVAEPPCSKCGVGQGRHTEDCPEAKHA